MAFDDQGSLYTANEKCLRVLADKTLETMETVDETPAWGKVSTMVFNDSERALLTSSFKGNFATVYRTEFDSGKSAKSQKHTAATAAEVPVASSSSATSRRTRSMAAAAAPDDDDQTSLPTSATVSIPTKVTRSSSRRASILPPPVTAQGTAIAGEKGETADAATAKVAAAQLPQQQQCVSSSRRRRESAALLPPPLAPAGVAASTVDKENQGGSSSSSEDRRAGAAETREAVEKKQSTTTLDKKSKLACVDKEIMTNTLLHRTTLTNALSTRLTHLQEWAVLWKEGNVLGTFRRLAALHDSNLQDNGRLTVLADFLRVIDITEAAALSMTETTKANTKTRRSPAATNLEAALLLLPTANSLLALDFDNHVHVGLRTLQGLLSLSGTYVKDILQTPVASGVDLNREERVAKCQAFHDGILAAHARVQTLIRAFKAPPSSSVPALAQTVGKQVEEFLK